MTIFEHYECILSVYLANQLVIVFAFVTNLLFFQEKSNPSEVECLGRRKYADVVVQTFTGDQLASVSQENVLTIEQPQGCSMQPTTSGSSLSSKASTELSGEVFLCGKVL